MYFIIYLHREEIIKEKISYLSIDKLFSDL